MDLIFQATPIVTVATNTFINVPVVFQYEDTPLIEIIREQGIGFTTQIPIYHQDGTYLAKVTGNRVYPTEAGAKANISIRNLYGKFICLLDDKVMFELTHGVGDAFTASAELFTPDGRFVKLTDAPGLDFFDTKGGAIQVGGIVMSGNTFENLSIGIWLRENGACSIGVT